MADLIISLILITSYAVSVAALANCGRGAVVGKKEKSESLNRIRWQREVYGFEFYPFGSVGVGKHRKNATKEQNENWIRDRKNNSIQKNYEEWKKIKGL